MGLVGAALLRAHAVRLLLSTVAVVLGTAFIAGTLVLSDSLRAALFDEAASTAHGVDVAVSAHGTHGADGAVPARLLGRVRDLPGVATAAGRVVGAAGIQGRDGTVLTNLGTSGQVFAAPPDPALGQYPLREGAWPTGEDQLALDAPTAQRQGFDLGGRVMVLDKSGGWHVFRLVGTFRPPPSVASQAGMAALTPSQAGRVLGLAGFDRLDMRAAGGADPATVQREVQTAVGAGYRVRSGDQLRDGLAREAVGGVDLLTTGLLLFAAMAMVVAAFVIYNTFIILVAHRLRELALLRCVGAGRRQVFAAVLAESAAVGVMGSLIGLAVGAGLAAALRGLVRAPGAVTDHPPLSVLPRTGMVVLAVGVLVTVCSGLVPARQATRVPPVAALQAAASTEASTRRAGRPRTILAAVLTVGGLLVIGLGRAVGGTGGLLVIAGGGLLLFGALLAAGPVLVPRLIAVLGVLPSRWFGLTTELAVGNARSHPRRAATTTAALTIGVSVLSLIAVVTVSVRDSATDTIDRQYPIDYLIRPAVAGSPLPAGLAPRLRASDPGATLTELRTHDDVRLGDPATGLSRPAGLGGLDAQGLGSLVHPIVRSGSLADLGAGTLAVHASLAGPLGLRTGQQVLLRGADGRQERLTVAAIWAGDLLIPPILATPDTFSRLFGPGGPDVIGVRAPAGAAVSTDRARLDRALGGYPGVTVDSLAELRAQLTNTLDNVLAFLSTLVGLALLIAIFGVANTLSLSILERTRESTLLRALGLERRQLQRMICAEALLMAAVALVLGLSLGIGLGWAAATVGAAQYGGLFRVPVEMIAAFAVAISLAAVLASVLPARRAATASIVRSLAEG